MIQDEAGLTVRQLGHFMRTYAWSQGLSDDTPIAGCWASIKTNVLEAGVVALPEGYVPFIVADIKLKL
jgi:hypothetical protein